MNGRLTRERVAYLYRLNRQSERASKAAILEMIEPRPGGRLLDWGCGDGEFTVEVACRARVSEAYGLERLDERIAEATDRGVIVTKGDPNGPLPYRSRFFDIVHASQVECLPDLDLFLEEIRRVLRPEGYAIVSTRLAGWHKLPSLIVAMPADRPSILSEAILGKTFDLLRRRGHPSAGDTPSRIWGFQGLRVERWAAGGFWPFLPSLARSIGERHVVPGAFWVARLRPEP